VASLKILSGGAAQGLVAAVAAQFTSKTGYSIDGTFGAVGVMAAKLREGAAADVMISTAALIAELQRDGLLTQPAAAIGSVETAVAVRAADAMPAIGDEAQLRAALLDADAIYVPDIVASTAGIHVAKVLQQLGVLDAVRARLKIHPNGATAMHELAGSRTLRPIGCTQSTEIIATSGLKLVGPLPPACALATVYAAAVTTQAADAEVARRLIEILVSPDQSEARAKAGFKSSHPSLRAKRSNPARAKRANKRAQHPP
jgi:molybdate transport system substrate-binding protein